MNYFKTAMFVPGKGQAWMYSEADENLKVYRTLTHIPNTKEIERIADPVVKILFMPERLMPATEEEFLSLWNQPS
jgi:hypothetical protein